MIEGSGSIPLTNGSGSRRPNPTDQDTDSDPDPQHWFQMIVTMLMTTLLIEKLSVCFEMKNGMQEYIG
jgi:hypothetical protein